MPTLVAQKREFVQSVKDAGRSQFWGQPTSSALSIDGVATTVACEPQPLSLGNLSGLARPQFLCAAQAAGIALLPGYCKEHGGLVSAVVSLGTCARSPARSPGAATQATTTPTPTPPLPARRRSWTACWRCLAASRGGAASLGASRRSRRWASTPRAGAAGRSRST
jgi:hypothetical protein